MKEKERDPWINASFDQQIEKLRKTSDQKLMAATKYIINILTFLVNTFFGQQIEKSMRTSDR